MVIVSYGTGDGKYDRFLERLAESCRLHGLHGDFRIIPPAPRLEACLQKPAFIREMLQKHDRPVVWLDADTMVRRRFELPEGAWDIGVVPNTSRFRRRRNPTSAFVIAVAPTKPAFAFLDAWQYLCSWPELSGRTDHGRLTWTREIRAGTYREANLTSHLRGSIVRDFGLRKQRAL